MVASVEAIKIEPRAHQVKASEAVQNTFMEIRSAALVVAPCGWGKTILFSMVIDWYLQGYNKPVLVIAHRDELLSQAADKIRLVRPESIIGKVGGGFHEWGAEITVASIQTIYQEKYLKLLKQFGYGLVIVDECHHCVITTDENGAIIPGRGNTYQRVAETLPDAYWLGVTATPDRLDRNDITGFFGAACYQSDIVQMIEEGWLADIRAIAIKTKTSLDGIHTQAGDYKVSELAERIDSDERNQRIVDAYQEHASGRQFLCFSVDVAHAVHMAAKFQESGLNVAMVSGNTPTEQRKQIIRDYGRGRIQGICNCGILTEGYDDPLELDDTGQVAFTSCIIMARPTQSRALMVQCLGRGVRLAPGKTDCLILDITDNVLKHSLKPQTLARVMNRALVDGESVIEAKEREEKEVRERRERTTKEGKRDKDITINILAKLDWQRREDGMFILEVGAMKHRIALVPCKEWEGMYNVYARLAPMFDGQTWLTNAPLSWAQQVAEKKARMLLADPKSVALVDKTAPWRAAPATETQLEKLEKWAGRFGIKYDPATITKGEASEHLDFIYGEFSKWRNQKARKAV